MKLAVKFLPQLAGATRAPAATSGNKTRSKSFVNMISVMRVMYEFEPHARPSRGFRVVSNGAPRAASSSSQPRSRRTQKNGTKHLPAPSLTNHETAPGRFPCPSFGLGHRDAKGLSNGVHKGLHNQSQVRKLQANVNYVFVSSELFDGDLRGTTGADARCQRMADSASLLGTYKACISTSDADAPIHRFNKSTKPYALTDQTIVAAGGWDDLVNFRVENWDAIDECGNKIGPNSGAMTSTRPYGIFVEEDDVSCLGYTSNSDADLATNADMWSDPFSFKSMFLCDCGNNKKLICFQQ